MTRAEKQAFVTDMRDRLERSGAIFLTDFTGLNVQSMTTLRGRIKKLDGEVLVVKNRLLRRAIADTDMPELSEWLKGPTAVVFGDPTVVGAAKAVVDFARENDNKPVFKVGVVDSAVLEPEDITRLSTLPSRDELLSQVAGALEGPMSTLVSALEGKTPGDGRALRSAAREAGVRSRKLTRFCRPRGRRGARRNPQRRQAAKKRRPGPPGETTKEKDAPWLSTSRNCSTPSAT